MWCGSFHFNKARLVYIMHTDISGQRGRRGGYYKTKGPAKQAAFPIELPAFCLLNKMFPHQPKLDAGGSHIFPSSSNQNPLHGLFLKLLDIKFLL